MGQLLAVDGGGTKTHFVLYDTALDKVVDSQFLGATNHELLNGGYSEMRQRMHEMTRGFLAENGLAPEDLEHTVWGAAGMDTNSQYKIIHEYLSELGFKRFTLANDSYLGIKAALPDGYGICLISGTGYNVVGINDQQNRYQVGGQFEITGDFAGGLTLGREAIKTTFFNLYRNRRETILSKMVMELYEVDSRHDFMDRVTDWNDSGKIPVPWVAKCVFDAGNLGDEESVAMLKRMGEEYALGVKTLVEELPFADKNVHIVLAGSLFTKGWSDIHLKALEAQLKRHIPEKDFVLHVLECPPVIGALVWGFEDLGISEPFARAHACLDAVKPQG